MTEAKIERKPRKAYTQNYKCMACGYNHLVPRSWAAVAPSRCLNPACSNAGKLMEQYKKPEPIPVAPVAKEPSEFVKGMLADEARAEEQRIQSHHRGVQFGLRYRDLTEAERAFYKANSWRGSVSVLLDDIAIQRNN